MNKNGRLFKDRLQVDPSEIYTNIIKKQKLFKLLNDYPEILDSLSVEKLKVIERIYAGK